MERNIRKITFALVAILLVVQGYLFFKEYDGVAYASQGEKMSETTWLYARDTLMLEVTGQLPKDFQILKNGEPLAVEPDAGGCYVLEVKQHDLIEISGTAEGSNAWAEIRVTLKNGVFQEKYYADVFDYAGGSVTIGWFIEK